MISSFVSFGINLNSKPRNKTVSGPPYTAVATPTFNYSASGNLLFAYSLRVIVPGYTGPVVNIRRSTDNTNSDFYTDYNQTFFTNTATSGGINNGTPYSTWIGGGLDTLLNGMTKLVMQNMQQIQILVILEELLVLQSNQQLQQHRLDVM